jgi:hypothetical protein
MKETNEIEEKINKEIEKKYQEIEKIRTFTKK